MITNNYENLINSLIAKKDKYRNNKICSVNFNDTYDLTKGFPIISELYDNNKTDGIAEHIRCCYDEMLWIFVKRTPDISSLEMGDNIKKYRRIAHRDNTVGTALGYQAGYCMRVDDSIYMNTIDVILSRLEVLSCETGVFTFWNTHDLYNMAIFPNVLGFTLNVIYDHEIDDVTLNMMVIQKTCDMVDEYNDTLISYGLLLKMFAQHIRITPRFLTVNIAKPYIFKNTIYDVNKAINKDDALNISVSLDSTNQTFYSHKLSDLYIGFS